MIRRALPAVLAGTLAVFAWTASCVSPSSAAAERDLPLLVLLHLPVGGPPLNEHFTLEVVVHGPIPEKMVVGADMPAHRHGMLSEPIVTEPSPGLYRVEGMLLHMTGEWVITVEVLLEGETILYEFPITIDFDLEP